MYVSYISLAEPPPPLPPIYVLRLQFSLISHFSVLGVLKQFPYIYSLFLIVIERYNLLKSHQPWGPMLSDPLFKPRLERTAEVVSQHSATAKRNRVEVDINVYVDWY